MPIAYQGTKKKDEVSWGVRGNAREATGLARVAAGGVTGGTNPTDPGPGPGGAKSPPAADGTGPGGKGPGGTGPGGTGPGGTGPGGTGPGGTGPGLTWPKLPTLTKPAWYQGVWPPNSLAGTIRNGWFAFLGDMSQYPYNANKFYVAYVDLAFISGDGTVPDVPLPIPLTVTIFDAGGNAVGVFVGSLTTVSILPVDIAGAFNLLGMYTVQVDYTMPGGSQQTATFGPFVGSLLANGATPMGLELTVNTFNATLLGAIQVNNSDGTPAGANYPVTVVLWQEDSQLSPYFSGRLFTNAQGQVTFKVSADSNATQIWNVGVNVYAQGSGYNSTPVLVGETFYVSAAQITAGISETLVLPVPGSNQNAGIVIAHFYHGHDYLNASPVEFVYTCTNQNGTELANLSAKRTGSGALKLPAPAAGSYAATDTLTFALLGTWTDNGETAKASVTITGASFDATGAQLLLEFA